MSTEGAFNGSIQKYFNSKEKDEDCEWIRSTQRLFCVKYLFKEAKIA